MRLENASESGTNEEAPEQASFDLIQKEKNRVRQEKKRARDKSGLMSPVTESNRANSVAVESAANEIVEIQCLTALVNMQPIDDDERRFRRQAVDKLREKCLKGLN